MSTWIIGDLQGCAASFGALRKKIAFDPSRDVLHLVGDLVNRGPASLDTLRWVFEHRHCVHTVLGNHDLHLLWCALGSGTPHGRDTLLDILHAPDADELIDWLRTQPLLRVLEDAVIVHAGIHPTWRIASALEKATAAQRQLQSTHAGDFLDRMRAQNPQNQSEAEIFQDLDILTRMRTLYRADLSLNTRYAGTLENIPSDAVPWFQVPSQHPRPLPIFFGHWAALGVHQHPPYHALDSGCVWGNSLTAWRLEDGTIVQQPAIDPPVEQTDGQRLAHNSKD